MIRLARDTLAFASVGGFVWMVGAVSALIA